MAKATPKSVPERYTELRTEELRLRYELTMVRRQIKYMEAESADELEGLTD